MKNKWKNLGDINFLAYGGCLVQKNWSEADIKKCPNLTNVYQVFSLNTEAGEDGDEYSAMLCCVDLDDLTAEVVEDILDLNGLEELSNMPLFEIMSPEQWAKEMVECGTGLYQPTSYKSQYPSSWEDYILTEDELKEWLKALGAEEFV